MSSFFIEKSVQPTLADLQNLLGRSYAHWKALLNLVEEEKGLLVEWKFYGKKHGWQVKVSKKKRSVLYMIPHEKSFLVGMALNKKAMEELVHCKLPQEFISEIQEAKAYPEGKPARVEVRTKKDVGQVKELMKLKLLSL